MLPLESANVIAVAVQRTSINWCCTEYFMVPYLLSITLLLFAYGMMIHSMSS